MHVILASVSLCAAITAAIVACHFAINTPGGRRRYREFDAAPRTRWLPCACAHLLTILPCFSCHVNPFLVSLHRYYGLTEPVRCCEPCVKIIRITTRRNSALALRDSATSASAAASAAVAAANALGTPSPLEAVEEDVVVEDDVPQERSQAQAQLTPGADDSLGFSPSPTVGAAGAAGGPGVLGKASSNQATDAEAKAARRGHRNTMAAASPAPAVAVAGAKPKGKGKKRRSVI